LVLLGTLLRFGVQLRTRAIALKRRAGLEYLIASLSMRFIPSQSEGVENDIVRALAELGRYIGADRAYVLFSDRSRRQYLWSQPGTPTAQDWPNRALVLSRDMPRTTYGGIHVRRVDFLPDGSVKNDLVAAGLASWACVVRHNVDGKADLLGFDALHPARTSWRNDLGLLRMAFEAIASAVGREQLEMDRNRLQEHLQRTRRLETIGALASGIAHNFNNIAGAIIGYTELIETETRPVERAARNLAAIRRAAERASDLVDQILAYGKRRTTPPQLVDLRTLFIEAADLVHASFPSAIGLVVRQAPDTVIVTGEPAQIQQVIINLCNNAAQAMPDGGSVQLTLETSNIDQGRALSHGALSVGRYARITVGDAGHGIDANVMEHLFEPFFTGRSGGNGLGLATVREIVDDHCGAIDVCTSPGKGTRIDVWLPCSIDILSWSSGPHDHDDMIFGRGEAVLLVHSDPVQLLKDEEMIAALGYEPVGFSNTVEALAACREDPARFHASIVSQCPTEREALDIAASLHAIDPLLPIVLALASSEEFLPAVLADVGVSEILRRPLTSSNTAVALKSIDRQ